MGRRILASLLAMALIFALPVFSFSAGEGISLKDSGSPMVSMMALRSIAADEGISLAASEGNSGQFGYDIKPVDIDYSIGYSNYTNSSTGNKFKRSFIQVYNLEPGTYSFTVKSLNAVTSAYVYYWDTQLSQYTSNLGTSVKFDFTVTSQTNITLWLYAPVDSFDSYDQNTVLSISPFVLKPVEGISCGWSVHEAFSETNRRDAFEDFTWNFGDQPAGNYILNIYHYGIAYTCDWHIAYGSSPIGENSRFIPVSNSNGVSTAIISHGGGNLTLSGEVIFAHPYGDGYFDGTGSYSEYGGSGSISLDFFQRDNWSYAVSDVIIVPLDAAGLEQFGVFGPLIGFLRDGFSSIKSNVVTQFTQLKTHLTTEFSNLKTSISTQFTQLKTQLTTQYNGMKTFIEQQVTRIVGDDDTESDVQSAADELNKEVQDLQSLSGDLNTQSSNLQQQFSTDFAIPDELSSNSSNIQLIFSFIFSTFGIYTIFIWLPVVLAVIKKLLRL